MRQKIAKALAREARAYAEQTGRTTDVLSVHVHPTRWFKEPMEELNPDGTMRYRLVSFRPETLFLSDGPRFFRQRLKRAYKQGLLMGVGR